MDKRTKQTKDIRNLLYFIAGIVITGFGFKLDAYLKLPTWESKQAKIINTLELKSPLQQLRIQPVEAKETTPQATRVILTKEVERDYIVKGKVSFYSWNGCLGCNENRIMSNGEQLDDSKFTVALYPRLLKQYKNQIVTVENLDNGKKVNCKVTDSGGFEKYNRIADLSKATYDYLEAKTDISNIVIYQ